MNRERQETIGLKLQEWQNSGKWGPHPQTHFQNKIEMMLKNAYTLLAFKNSYLPRAEYEVLPLPILIQPDHTSCPKP